MLSRCGIFCRVIETGSFTRAAEQLGYTQSAVSQTVKALEQELGATLIERRKDGLVLTADGERLYPHIRGVYHAEAALEQRCREMQGLEDSTIHMGVFTSVSRNLLPPLMERFKQRYPQVRFLLRQGEYTSISQWVQEGSVDFGFVNADAVSGLTVEVLYRDEMAAVLPEGHPLAEQPMLSLRQLAQEPFILLDEGAYSVLRHAFQEARLSPRIEYEVYDDYTILAMVRQHLGVSAMYRLAIQGFEGGLAVRPIREKPERPVALAWKRWETLPFAARRFVEFLRKNVPTL